MNQWKDLQSDPRTIRPMQAGWEFTIQPNLSLELRFINNLDSQFASSSVGTRTQTWCDGSDLLGTLFISMT